MSSSIKDRIRKLLAMTEARGATEAEAAVALEKAQALLKEHNLEIDEVSGEAAPRNYEEVDAWPGYPWARDIASGIAHLYDCMYLYERGGKLNRLTQKFVGRQSNAETARLITEFVVKTIMSAGRKAQAAAGGNNRFQRDFAVGASQRIVSRAYALWCEANKELIEERERRYREQAANQPPPMAKPDLNNLPDLPEGQVYTIMVYSHNYRSLKETTARTGAEVRLFVAGIVAKPPRGAAGISITAPGWPHSFSWVLFERPQKERKNSGDVQNFDAYAAGTVAAENIGLRVQVGGSDPKKIK